MARVVALEQNVAPILTLALFDTAQRVCPHWKHIVDLGVGQDVVGGLFYEVVY